MAALGFLAVAPGIARAGVFAGGGITFPTTATVGDTGLPASVAMTNSNTPPNAGDTNTVCNAGDTSPPCGAPELGIVLVPSCKQVAAGQCTASGADPGVFQVSSTATGHPGTACGGMTFSTAVIDATFGTVRFTPQPAGTHVTLPGAGASCVIDFTFSVLKSPTGDADPATPGNQTEQQAANTQYSSILNNEARGTSIGTTVVRAATAIATTASPNIAIGGQLTDSATVSGRVNPVAGATIDFKLYGPGNTTCAGQPVSESVVAQPVADGPVVSAPFTPAQSGTYRWVASYSGDANNAPATGGCADPNESSGVFLAVPAISTHASPDIALGAGVLTDTETVTGRINPQPGATIDFKLYPPTDTACTGTPVFTSLGLPYPVAGGPVTSAPFTPTQPGTYRWVASYSGDANNAPVTEACNSANENTTVSGTSGSTGPQIALIKVATPPSLPAPGGTFTFTARVSDPSTLRPVTITRLVDNIYGDLATRPGSTCKALIGVTLAPGATSEPCSFTGSFTGSAGASQTDVITVTGTDNGVTVTATAHATVTLTPNPKLAGSVSPLKLLGPASCVSTAFRVFVAGKGLSRVTYYLEGKRLAVVTKRDANGNFVLTVNPRGLSKGKLHHLSAVLTPVPHSGRPVITVRRTFAVCAKPTLPRFTG